MLLLNFISILLYKLTYLSLLLSIISLISSIILLRNKKIFLIIISILSILTIFIHSIKIYNNYQMTIDVFKDENILQGSWIYNEYDGKYTFNNDYTYIQYTNESTKDNYCKGTYKYHYGVTNDKGITIRQDENYYYYTLTLKEEYCLILNKKFYDEYTKIMYLGIKKDNNNEITMINKDNNTNMIYLTKVSSN